MEMDPGSEAGPYVAAAVFCEQVLREQDSVNSLIRIIDRITIRGTGPEVPQTLPPTVIPLKLYLAMKNGRARGSLEMTVRPEKPSGEAMDPQHFSMPAHGAEGDGTNIVLELQFPVDQAGLYWFDVFRDERLLTRVPLHVVYMYQRT